MSMVRLTGRIAVAPGLSAHVIVLAVVTLLGATTHASNLDIVAAGKRQSGVTRFYDPSYRKLAFPDGDVPNPMTYLASRSFASPIKREAASYRPGDIGSGARAEDILLRYRIIDQYRLPPAAAIR